VCAAEVKADDAAWARWQRLVDKAVSESGTDADQAAADKAWEKAGAAQNAMTSCELRAGGG
jgi:hypothetical protein